MVLSIHKVSKSYGNSKKKALDDFSASLTPGVYGILGPNGSGKSTLMNIITDNIKANSGLIEYDGVNVLKMGREFRNILGYMPQHQGIYDEFTANRFLWYMSALKGLKKKQARERIEYVFDLVNLRDDAHKKLGAFSGGMKQRILIAQALLNDPKILILDEPTAGLDPKERVRIRNFISEIALNKIVLFATHVVSDIEYVAKEVIFLKQGRLIQKDKPSNILSDMSDKVWQARIPAESLYQVQKEYIVSSITGESNNAVTVKIVADDYPTGLDASPVIPALEDIYLYLFRDCINI
jgi:ABC-type multidrug transport system ATPase subunit